MESFQELGLPPFLGKSLQQMNFKVPTPIQAQAIPAALEGRDVIASAQTGTGKTAAFGISLLNYLDGHPGQTAMVLTPTRELAAQVLEVLRKLSGGHPLGGSVLLIGGAPMASQLSSLSRKPRLIIGTPGRVIDHLNRGTLSLAQAGFLVLDEADRMLDMGFAPQLEEIRKRLPEKRQTLLFSATLPPNIQAMGSRYLKDPVRIAVGEASRPIPKISQMTIHTTEARKFEELLGELGERQGSVLVFARTQNRVDRVMEKLKDAGIKVTRIHGGRTQSQRRQAIEHFREGHYRVLVATDIAARGLDIHHIAHVINYDLPRNPEDYIHRVGRTARAGAEGSSLCLLTPEDRGQWAAILRLIGSTQLSVVNKPSRFGDFTPKAAQPPVFSDRPFKKRDERTDSQGKRRGFSPDRPGHKRVDPRRKTGSFNARPSQGPRNHTWSDRSKRQGAGFRPASSMNLKENRQASRNRPWPQAAGQGNRGNTFIYHGPGESASPRNDRRDWNRKPGGFSKHFEPGFSHRKNAQGGNRPYSGGAFSGTGHGSQGERRPNSFGNHFRNKGRSNRNSSHPRPHSPGGHGEKNH